MAEYIDKKQAIDRIASCYCMDCEHSNGILCRACEHQDDMDLIDDMPAADVQPVDRWISCKEKMPDDGVNVLIYAGNRMISLAWYDKDMGYFYICDSDYKYNSLDVTHWQPLPEPPEAIKG